MGRTKGHIKTGGREKGTPNKVTTSTREWIKSLIERNRKQIEKDFSSLEPKDRILMFEKLLQYMIPRYQSQQYSINYSTLSEEQLDRLIRELTKSIYYDNQN